MPLTLQAVSISGESQEAAMPYVYVTYQIPILNDPINPSVDAVPGFMYLMGNVEYYNDTAGNVIAVNRNIDGSLPI